MTKYIVREGVRQLQFEGERLAHSSSWASGKSRWVEFEIYRTLKGSYVISRIGMSLLYHDIDCKTVTRNRLSAVDETDLDLKAVACLDCKPSRMSPEGVFPETPRHWALSTSEPKGVIAACMQRDDNGAEYLTNVAKRALEDAAELDDGIDEAFYEVTIE